MIGQVDKNGRALLDVSIASKLDGQYVPDPHGLTLHSMVTLFFRQTS